MYSVGMLTVIFFDVGQILYLYLALPLFVIETIRVSVYDISDWPADL